MPLRYFKRNVKINRWLTICYSLLVDTDKSFTKRKEKYLTEDFKNATFQTKIDTEERHNLVTGVKNVLGCF